ncbi:hypothetical protein [Ferrimonas marina]|uniref:Uncharacterized protein n=1 Tax=Ferrimonas marina TaxID=299255 RepID=A0A1M5T9N5_9GAMM|nr:hypothetical protein [Ferrimonas marina]SHH47330.1 hypothetical protein SAMN02745129_2049 [Ferrimonas marina]
MKLQQRSDGVDGLQSLQVSHIVMLVVAVAGVAVLAVFKPATAALLTFFGGLAWYSKSKVPAFTPNAPKGEREEEDMDPIKPEMYQARRRPNRGPAESR